MGQFGAVVAVVFWGAASIAAIIVPVAGYIKLQIRRGIL